MRHPSPPSGPSLATSNASSGSPSPSRSKSENARVSAVGKQHTSWKGDCDDSRNGTSLPFAADVEERPPGLDDAAVLEAVEPDSPCGAGGVREARRAHRLADRHPLGGNRAFVDLLPECIFVRLRGGLVVRIDAAARAHDHGRGLRGPARRGYRELGRVLTRRIVPTARGRRHRARCTPARRPSSPRRPRYARASSSGELRDREAWKHRSNRTARRMTGEHAAVTAVLTDGRRQGAIPRWPRDAGIDDPARSAERRRPCSPRSRRW